MSGDSLQGPDAPLSANASLPVSLTSFVGREQETREIERLLGSSRLLTLTGVGGSGKTRLALEVVARSAVSAPQRVVWVELAQLGDPSLVPQQVATVLALRDEGSRSPTEALVGALRARSTLLVLDNCEHLVNACAVLADTLLRACPELRILATSREPLGVAGERAWLVPPLSLPPAAVRTAEALLGSEAVRLFVERARDVLPGFELTDANAAAVADICQRLDGIPLAIELAAARVRVLPPEQIAARLDNAFRLLTTGRRTALPRHRTLRSAIDWSFALLTAAEQVVLRRLSVFSGGFTLEAEEEVCTGGEVEPGEALDLLTHLVDRSLVVMREHGGTARYHLLETVRQYAAERLAISGEEGEIRRRHAEYFCSLSQEAEPHFTTVRRRAWMDRLYPEIDNLRQALAWTRENETELHLRFAGTLGWFWFSSRHWAEGRRWYAQALALPEAGAPTRERAALLLASGILATLQGESALARSWLEESGTLAASLGDRRIEAYSRVYIGMALASAGLMDGKAITEAALACFRAVDDLYGLRIALLVLSTFALLEGDISRAAELAEEAVRVARAFGQDRELALALQVLGMVALRQGETDRAASLLRESLATFERDPFYLFMARAVEFLAVIHCLEGTPLQGARLFGAAAAIREAIGARTFPIDEARYAPHIAAARTALGEEAFGRAWEEGRAMTVEETMDAALAAPAASAAPAGPSAPAALRAAAPRIHEPRPKTADLVVRALGPLEIHWNGDLLPPDAFSYARPRELLLNLLAQPQGRTRAQIGLAFWPEGSPAQVKNSFNVMLYHLRKALGRPDCVVQEGEYYRINPELEVWFDAAVFEAEVSSALRDLRSGRDARERLDAALALYRGGFLEGESAGDWHLEHHDRLQRLFTDGLTALADLLLDAGDLTRGAEVLERLVLADELREDAHRRLMVCAARLGNRARALRHYERVVALLRAELDADPEPETSELFERIRRAEPV